MADLEQPALVDAKVLIRILKGLTVPSAVRIGAPKRPHVAGVGSFSCVREFCLTQNRSP